MTKRPWPKVRGKMIRLRRILYWLGLRPRVGSIWYSPSMAYVFGYYDATIQERDLGQLNETDDYS